MTLGTFVSTGTTPQSSSLGVMCTTGPSPIQEMCTPYKKKPNEIQYHRHVLSTNFADRDRETTYQWWIGASKDGKIGHDVVFLQHLGLDDERDVTQRVGLHDSLKHKLLNQTVTGAYISVTVAYLNVIGAYLTVSGAYLSVSDIWGESGIQTFAFGLLYTIGVSSLICWVRSSYLAGRSESL